MSVTLDDVDAEFDALIHASWPTVPGKRYGHTEPRIFTPPLRPLTPTTSLGFSVIEFADWLGVNLLPWQRWLLIHALELTEPWDDDGAPHLRFRTVLVLVARQNGKTMLSMVLGLWALYCWQTRLVLGTAQDLSLAEEVWSLAVDIAQDNPELAAEVRRVSRVNGAKSLELLNRSKWQCKATNRRAGRGKTAGLLQLDELREHTSWEAWGALSKTTLAVRDALIWCTTNAGDAASVVLRHLRRMAHLAIGDPDREYGDGPDLPLPADTEDDAEALEESLAIFEWSALPNPDVWDRDQWAMANPSMGYTITEAAIASSVRTDPAPVVITEILCQWLTTSRSGPFPGTSWEDGMDPESEIPLTNRTVFGLAVSANRSYATLAVAGLRADGRTHVEIVQRAAGTAWIKDWFTARASVERPMSVVIRSAGAPEASVIQTLTDVPGLHVVPWGGKDLGIGHALLYDLVAEDRDPGVRPKLVHLPQPVLDVPAATATTKPIGDMWVWQLRSDGEDVAPLIAVTASVWGLHRGAPAPRRSAYADHDLLVI